MGRQTARILDGYSLFVSAIKTTTYDVSIHSSCGVVLSLLGKQEEGGDWAESDAVDVGTNPSLSRSSLLSSSRRRRLDGLPTSSSAGPAGVLCLLSLLRSQDFDSLGPSSRSLHKLPSHQFNTLLLPTSSTLRWTHDAIVVSHSRPCVRRLSSLVLLACTKWTSRLASRSFDCFLSVCIHRASSSCDASSSELLPFSCYSRIRFPIFGLSERRSCSLPSPFAVA